VAKLWCTGAQSHNLPAYAPELNPDDQVWNNGIESAYHSYITRKEMQRAALRALRSIQANTQLIHLFHFFFRLRDTEYAAVV
jgi:hypothetical protein